MTLRNLLVEAEDVWVILVVIVWAAEAALIVSLGIRIVLVHMHALEPSGNIWGDSIPLANWGIIDRSLYPLFALFLRNNLPNPIMRALSSVNEEFNRLLWPYHNHVFPNRFCFRSIIDHFISFLENE